MRYYFILAGMNIITKADNSNSCWVMAKEEPSFIAGGDVK